MQQAIKQPPEVVETSGQENAFCREYARILIAISRRTVRTAMEVSSEGGRPDADQATQARSA